MPARYWYVILTYIIMQFSVYILLPLTPVLSALHLSFAEATLYWSVISFFLGVVIVLLLMRPDMKKQHARNGAFGIGLSILWIIAGVFMAYFAQVIAVLIETYVFDIQAGSENTADIMDGIRSVPLFMIVAVLFAPILEEVIFRKIIFGSIYKRTNFFLAALLSALIFGLIHMDPAHLLTYFMMGLVFAGLYVITKRIIVPIATHAIMNGMVVLVQYNLSPEDIERMQEQLQMIFIGG